VVARRQESVLLSVRNGTSDLKRNGIPLSKRTCCQPDGVRRKQGSLLDRAEPGTTCEILVGFPEVKSSEYNTE